MSAIISLRNINKEYVTYKRGSSFKEAVKSLFHREKVNISAVKDVSFEIEEGEIVGLLGKNGAGKSTTIKMLTGVLYPSSGNIQVMGYTPFKQRKKYVGKIGAVFGQKSQLIWDIPPMDSFVMNKAIYDIPEDIYNTQLNKLIRLFEVEEIVQKPTRVLSLGERMKCEFIMAMLHKPKVVFLDEPTIGLDIIAKETIRDFIVEMNKEGVTFILTTHDLEDIERLAHRVIVINHGEKVFEDSLDALKHHLGDKKTVSITMSGKVPEIKVPGIKVLERKTDKEADLLVDNAVISINDFITYINGLGAVQDISIKEIGIEEIVKTIYDKE